MSHLRALVAPVLAAALTPLLLTAPGTAMPLSADTATATRTAAASGVSTTTARKAQSARITVLPKVAQKGKGAKP